MEINANLPIKDLCAGRPGHYNSRDYLIPAIYTLLNHVYGSFTIAFTLANFTANRSIPMMNILKYSYTVPLVLIHLPSPIN